MRTAELGRVSTVASNVPVWALARGHMKADRPAASGVESRDVASTCQVGPRLTTAGGRQAHRMPLRGRQRTLPCQEDQCAQKDLLASVIHDGDEINLSVMGGGE
jgi:hypothetical protein